MPIQNPENKRIQLYDVQENRQYLAPIEDVSNGTPVNIETGYNTVTQVTLEEGPLAVVIDFNNPTPPEKVVPITNIQPRGNIGDPLRPPGWYQVHFQFTATLNHITADELKGGRLLIRLMSTPAGDELNPIHTPELFGFSDVTFDEELVYFSQSSIISMSSNQQLSIVISSDVDAVLDNIRGRVRMHLLKQNTP